MARLFGSGKARAARQAQAEGERRQVTVLFYDIVGSVDMVRALDAEEVRARLLDVHETARRLMAEHAGSLEQVLGDGGMAYFGFRTVTEDAVLQAVEAAAALLDARAGMAAAPDIRIGIATSVVVVPKAGLGPDGSGLGAVGVAPNLAARLQSASAPNTVLVSETTYRLTRQAFAYNRVDGLALKGFPDVTGAWRLAGRLDLASRFERARATGTALVARRAETERLDAAWREAQAGRGCALLLEGEAGIGKSRLARHMLDTVVAGGARRILLQAQPATSGEALFAVIDMYERAHAAPETDPALAEAAAETAALVARLEEDVSLSAHARRAEIVRGAAGILVRLIAERPCLIVAEDLHWADEVTVALLAALARRAADLPLLLLCTARLEPVPDELRQIAARLDLAPLDAEDTRALIRAAAVAPLAEATLDWIVAKSDGNPLFATELARFAEDALAGQPDGPTALESATVDSLRDLLAARLETAGRAKRVAQIGSVIGRDVPFRLLVRLVRDRIPLDELEADLDRLIQHGIQELAASGDCYAFRHALIRDAAYDSQLRSTRKALHARIVDLVEEDTALGEAIPEEMMAEHYLMADRIEAAVERLVAAAERGLQLSALRGPRRMLDRALALTERIADAAERRMMALRAIALLGPTVRVLDGPREAAPLYERGQALVFELRPGERGPWFPVLWGWWFTAPTLREQAERSETMIRDISAEDSREARLQALHCGWATLYDAGEHARSLAAVEEGLALYNPVVAARSRHLYGHDARVCGLGERAQSLWMQGDVAGSLGAIAVAESWAEETGHGPSLLHALDMGTLAAFYRRDYAEIERLLKRVSAVSGEGDMPVVEAKRQTFDGWIAARRGGRGRGAAVEEGLRRLRDLGALEDTPIYADIAADAAARAGDPASALAALDGEIATARQSRLVFWLPELLRRRAILARAADGTAPVSAWLDEGLEVAEAQAAHMLVLRNVAARIRFGEPVPARVRESVAERIALIGDCPERAPVRDALGL